MIKAGKKRLRLTDIESYPGMGIESYPDVDDVIDRLAAGGMRPEDLLASAIALQAACDLVVLKRVLKRRKSTALLEELRRCREFISIYEQICRRNVFQLY